MANSKLMKAFYEALSMGNLIPDGLSREELKKLTVNFAETRKVEYTAEEMEEVLDYAMNNIIKDGIKFGCFPETKMMK